MKKKLKKTNTLSRRDFLRLSGLGVAAAAMPSVAGCSSLPGNTDYSDYHREYLLIKNCNIVDVKAGRIIENSALMIGRRKIISINRLPESLSSDTQVIDLEGKYVIPGLIDSHLHLTLTGVSGFELADVFATIRQVNNNFYNHIASGVTTVRDMGAVPRLLHDKIKKVKSGCLIGPRVVFCNRFVNIKGSHPSIKPEDLGLLPGIMGCIFGEPAMNFKNMEELKQKIEPNLDHGASFIKLTMDDKSLFCGKKGLPVYTDEMLKFILDFAHRKGVPIAAHQQYKYGFDRVLKYPVQSIEHLVSDSYISDDEAQRLVKNGTAIIPTCSVGSLLSYDEWKRFIPDEIKNNGFIKKEIEIRNNYLSGPAKKYIEPELHETNDKFAKYYLDYDCKELFEKEIYVANPSIFYDMQYRGYKNLLKLKQAGALIGCGTDAGIGYDYHGTLWYEIELMHRIGFKPDEILKCATVNNAKILRMDDKIGAIEEGKLADLVFLDRNPLRDDNMHVYRNPVATIKDGLLIHSNRKIRQIGETVTFGSDPP